MFERYLTDLLTTHFGHVIADLDSKQMAVSVWKNGLILNNVMLRHDAIDRFFFPTDNNDDDESNDNNDSSNNCPVEIAYGSIGQLQVHIPWKLVRNQILDLSSSSSNNSDDSCSNNKDLSSMPVSVVLTDVNILLTPRRRRRNDGAETSDNTDENQMNNNNDDSEHINASTTTRQVPQHEQDVIREQAVQAAMDAELLQRVTDSAQPLMPKDDNNKDSRQSNWKIRIRERMKSIISNLSVTIQNIHIRYEDPGTCLGFQWLIVDNDDDYNFLHTTNIRNEQRYRPSFAVGITLKEFSLQTATTITNDNTKQDTDTQQQDQHQEKVAKIQQLAAYWDSDCRIIAKQQPIMSGNDAEQYFYEAFADLNSAGIPTKSRLNIFTEDESQQHTFLLDPFSPSVHFTLSPKNHDNDDLNDNNNNFNIIDVALPACHFTISRNLLEDIGYLRKSLAVWMHSKKGLLLPEETVRRLIKLRPKESAEINPRGWWKYLYEAVLALRHNSDIAKRKKKMNGDKAGSNRKLHRNRGWLGVVEALSRRRRYINLYKDFLWTENNHERNTAHNALLEFERTLLTSEVVAFRIATFLEVKKEQERYGDSSDTLWTRIASMAPKNNDVDSLDDVDAVVSDLNANDPSKIFTIEHRIEMFTEMVVALNREHRNLELQKQTLAQKEDGSANKSSSSLLEGSKPILAWRTIIKCPEFSVQVNDHRFEISRSGNSVKQSTPLPVVRLSCAFVQEQELYQDGSFDLTNKIGSLVVKDCISTKSNESLYHKSRQSRTFSNYLVGPKGGSLPMDIKDGKFDLDGKTYHQSVMLKIRRMKKWNVGREVGYTTTTEARVLPLEIIYTTAAFESLNHVLKTASVELADDYNRVAHRMSVWRHRQQQRLLRALAHREKKMNVDIVIGAPVLLIPEERQLDSTLLVVDFGSLRFSNDEKNDNAMNTTYDDRWILELSNIQVMCITFNQYRKFVKEDGAVRIEPSHNQLLIEPFSLDFSIFTKVESAEDGESSGHTSIHLVATLPRLAVNLTTSAVRLIRRLQAQWKARRNARVPDSMLYNVKTEYDTTALNEIPARTPAELNVQRTLIFQFHAPLLSLQLENDVELRGSEPVTLFDLALKGIEGTLRNTSIEGVNNTTLSAKVRALGMIDLYQRAGPEFSLLLSSVQPETIGVDSGVAFHAFDRNFSGSDMVSFDYRMKDKPPGELHNNDAKSNSEEDENFLSINFSELFVEWNPETIANIAKALSFPADENSLDSERLLLRKQDTVSSCSQGSPVRDEFFDAEEDAFFDADCEMSEGGDIRPLSEIAESTRSSLSDFVTVAKEVRESNLFRLYSISHQYPPSAILDLQSKNGLKDKTSVSGREYHQPLVLLFSLSKLRVNFNKEVRHRRLMTAEMDKTTIRYCAMQGGGFKTNATIGNLTFSDCQSVKNKTLYREVLGLKTDNGGERASLLEMEMIVKPKLRRSASLKEDEDELAAFLDVPVMVDTLAGSVHGFDNFLKARFSPMRFVYLQQLWFEIVDYFFSGIVSNEIMGGVTPAPGDLSVLKGKSISADEVSFTRFDVTMESPVILFPVSSCSPDFIRLEASEIQFSNRYTYKELRPPTLRFQEDGVNLQWYNNCTLTMNDFSLFSWSGVNLTKKGSQPSALLSLCWPVGPSAPVNIPKWKVGCDIGALDLVLDKNDYALLQHIIQDNIGEDSHHLEEWQALQSLPSNLLQCYYEKIIVHFGYDNKDATPSTFDVTVRVPWISFLFQLKKQPIANVVCPNVSWNYTKFSDCISKQKIECDVEITSSRSDQVLLSSSVPATTQDKPADLYYLSSSHPSGDNFKTLQITDTRICAVYPGWKNLSFFFQSLPEPAYLPPDEAIQVGDRWYRIGNKSLTKPSTEADYSFDWIEGYIPSVALDFEAAYTRAPVYEFRFVLLRPSFVMGPSESQLLLIIQELNFHHEGQDNLIQRNMFVDGLELRTRNTDDVPGLTKSYLIQPSTIELCMKGCSGRTKCNCQLHSMKVSIGKLDARFAFSDMVRALDAMHQFHHDMRFSDETLQFSQTETGNHNVNESSCEWLPKSQSIVFLWSGLHLVVSDDTGRHFAGEQDLATIDLEDFRLEQKKAYMKHKSSMQDHNFSILTHVRLRRLLVNDCLQSKISPFHTILAMRSSPSTLNKIDFGAFRGEELDSKPESKESLISDEGDALEIWNKVDTSKIYNITFNSIELQYNPSVVVAMQRFLGRLLKKTRREKEEIVAISRDDDPNTGTNDDTQIKRANIDSQVSIDIKHLSICLNKEHQQRRLLEVLVSRSRFDIVLTGFGSKVQGNVGTFQATDPTLTKGSSTRSFLSSVDDMSNFLNFRYQTFRKRSLDIEFDKDAVPAWIHERPDHCKDIDDLLIVRVSALKFVFIRERTEELLDYLSNGMPGKSMGATSRAAKGFVGDRIEKRSFFEVEIEAPTIDIPQGNDSGIGLSVTLGDLILKSWPSSDLRKAVSREVESFLTGFSVVKYLETPNSRSDSMILPQMGISTTVEMASNCISVACRLSNVDICMSYSDYIAINLVIRDNLGLKIDKSKWDNLEVAWEKEAAETGFLAEDQLGFVKDVSYAPSARIVRYGRTESKSARKATALSLTFGNISVKLVNDSGGASCAYDMLLFCGHNFQSDFGQKEDGDLWMHVSIKEIFFFDLGRHHRLALVRKSTDGIAVLTEGYSPLSESSNSDTESSFDSQLVIKLEKEKASGATKAIIVVSCLTVAVFAGPFNELAQFFSCSWPVCLLNDKQNFEKHVPLIRNDDDGSTAETPTKQPFEQKFHLQFVAHYPRLVLAADEANLRSRGLILRGLAMANITSQSTAESESGMVSELTINADFQDVSSYITPDVKSIVGISKQRHSRPLADILNNFPTSAYDVTNNRAGVQHSDEKPIPLLLPLTVSIELQQRHAGRVRQERSLAVSVEPLAVIISNDDIQLIQSLNESWAVSRKPSSSVPVNAQHFDVVFECDRLGIGLMKENNMIVVDNVMDPSGMSPTRGDQLYAINGQLLTEQEKLSLSDLVERLVSEPRPLKITFIRKIRDGRPMRGKPGHPILDPTPKGFQISIDTLDLTMSEALLTLMEKDVPVFRSSISETKIACSADQREQKSFRFDFASSLTIDYYNLRIWDWEPFLEPGFIGLSCSFEEGQERARELSLEVTDGSGGLYVNLTDALFETSSKVLEWWREGEVSAEMQDILLSEGAEANGMKTIGRRDISTRAANAAYHYASRKKHDVSKPFLFRNKTGVSLAFALKNPNDQGKIDETCHPFAGVGDYKGLQSFDESDIVVVASEEDRHFRVNICVDNETPEAKTIFPTLTVAFQETNGYVPEALIDLPLSRPIESLLPLVFSSSQGLVKKPERKWLTWTVEYVDEKTVVTLATSIRLTPVINTVIEVGVETEDVTALSSPVGQVKSIGFLRSDSAFCLPLWLAMQSRPWNCYLRIQGDYIFAPLFHATANGRISPHKSWPRLIKCSHDSIVSKTVALLTNLYENGGVITFKIDCSLSIRNLLPFHVEWEVRDLAGQNSNVIDGTSARNQFYGVSTRLGSGELAEVLANGVETLQLRIKPSHDVGWSTWFSLGRHTEGTKKPISERNKTKETNKLDTEILIAKDPFSIALPMALRMAQKSLGLDVTLYTELWCVNCTSLNLSFGCLKRHISETTFTTANGNSTEELSAAEATLKEISSMFESGEAGAGLRQDENRNKEILSDTVRLPSQASHSITEECFEYVEVEDSNIVRRWWATEDPFARTDSIESIFDKTSSYRWIEGSWQIDTVGNTLEGWETSPNLSRFSDNRDFRAEHRYRRRRWTRSRYGLCQSDIVSGVTASIQPVSLIAKVGRDKKRRNLGMQVALRVDGGKWSVTSVLPRQGTVYGVIRVPKSRWPKALGTEDTDNAMMFEFSYVISPLDGDWGLLTRSMLVSARFLLRNDSSSFVFEVKQAGTPDMTAVQIAQGKTNQFHWGDSRLPELICVRPLVKMQGRSVYRWSGGFDPLTIGPVPLKIRKSFHFLNDHAMQNTQFQVHAIKLEADIRPRTGGTGITLSFVEENHKGEGSLYRIDNFSTFPIWLCQDGVLLNPSQRSLEEDQGDFLAPSDSIAFALDVPYRQGKYAHRKAATMEALLRVRIALAPLSSRAGIETTEVVSLVSDIEMVMLDPSKIIALPPDTRRKLRGVRIVGVKGNDGPTRVLTLRLVEKSTEKESFTYAAPISPPTRTTEIPDFVGLIYDSAQKTIAIREKINLPSVEEAVSGITINEAMMNRAASENDADLFRPDVVRKDLLVSFRASFSNLTISLVDSAPSEIAVAELKNFNAIASWDTQRITDSTVYVTISSIQVDNMVPNCPFPVAVSPFDSIRSKGSTDSTQTANGAPPLLVVGLSFAPKHKSGIVCLKSVTVAPRNLAIKVDLAFLVRLQKFVLDIQQHFRNDEKETNEAIDVPDLQSRIFSLEAAATSGVGRQKVYFGGLTILPCNVKLSVAPARALTETQAVVEGSVIAAIHHAVRKGDINFDQGNSGILGVKIGSRNKTPLAVVRGMFKSFLVDGLLRLDGASLNFAGVSLRNHTSTGPQLATALGAHYLASLRHNLPALLGSMAAFGNPLGLVRGLGEGVGDFVLEPVRGFQRSVQEMDASHLVDGVARGTVSLARHTVGGFADSAAMLAETFSKNMTVLTLDRRYAQKRDRGDMLRDYDDLNVASGLGSGVQKLVTGFLDGVTGVVKAPIRGAEKRGFEGFAKGVGKGLLGLLVKPIIGLSDGFTDVMIGVKGSVEGASGQSQQLSQIRPRRALYGRQKVMRPFYFADAAAYAIMHRTSLAGEPYLGHLDMGDRVVLLSSKHVLFLGRKGEELLLFSFAELERVEISKNEDGKWFVKILLKTMDRQAPSGLAKRLMIPCRDKAQSSELCSKLERGRKMTLYERE